MRRLVPLLTVCLLVAAAHLGYLRQQHSQPSARKAPSVECFEDGSCVKGSFTWCQPEATCDDDLTSAPR